MQADCARQRAMYPKLPAVFFMKQFTGRENRAIFGVGLPTPYIIIIDKICDRGWYHNFQMAGHKNVLNKEMNV
ncbi:hypothetical protein AYX07_10545 [Thermoactinomyces sp. AS95]|nr:hypothetical protein JS81_00260 [Thermoactinomyces sp. Gus2-1]KYQ86447.1 hypothetical protein AYX07_10545 [Thermoactinomyces sp. AS95]